MGAANARAVHVRGVGGRRGGGVGWAGLLFISVTPASLLQPSHFCFAPAPLFLAVVGVGCLLLMMLFLLLLFCERFMTDPKV